MSEEIQPLPNASDVVVFGCPGDGPIIDAVAVVFTTEQEIQIISQETIATSCSKK